MGPRLLGRGYESVGIELDVFNIPSMGPRLLGRGYLVCARNAAPPTRLPSMGPRLLGRGYPSRDRRPFIGPHPSMGPRLLGRGYSPHSGCPVIQAPAAQMRAVGLCTGMQVAHSAPPCPKTPLILASAGVAGVFGIVSPLAALSGYKNRVLAQFALQRLGQQARLDLEQPSIADTIAEEGMCYKRLHSRLVGPEESLSTSGRQ